MADDDRALMERLAVLEAEVKADADAQSARKAAAADRLREQRVTQAAQRDELRAKQAKPAAREAPRRARASESFRDPDAEDPASQLESLGSAMELATKANRVKQELTRAPKKGDKSWIASGVASLALGPVGWLYAGSMREAVPATAAWLALAALASKILPVFLMMPVLMVVLPLSAVAGVVYALQYNRSGTRQRLFDSDKTKAKTKQLRGG